MLDGTAVKPSDHQHRRVLQPRRVADVMETVADVRQQNCRSINKLAGSCIFIDCSFLAQSSNAASGSTCGEFDAEKVNFSTSVALVTVHPSLLHLPFLASGSISTFEAMRRPTRFFVMFALKTSTHFKLVLSFLHSALCFRSSQQWSFIENSAIKLHPWSLHLLPCCALVVLLSLGCMAR